MIPLVDEPLELAGMTLAPRPRAFDPLATVVTDRDLYRAERDTVYLFCAVASSVERPRLVIEVNSTSLTERELSVDKGVAIETLSMLVPGSYSAQLEVSGKRVGQPASFTVAEYRLAPLSARLRSHRLDRAANELTFELEVESYQQPFEGELEVALVEVTGRGRRVDRTRVRPESTGRYRGHLKIKGEGPFRFELISVDDAERTAQVALPGSRAAERDTSVLSELGRELLFAMMPEEGATPLRGGYLSSGDFLTTPLVVDEVVTNNRQLKVKSDIDELQLVLVDLRSGDLTVRAIGNKESGDVIEVSSDASLCMVFAGGLVSGRPFEGFVTFISPSHVSIGMQVPEKVRPGDELTIHLDVSGAEGAVPVLVSVRDQRLTAGATPSVGLGASVKKAVDDLTSGMSERGFVELESIFVDDLYGSSRDVMFEALDPASAGVRRSMVRARRSHDLLSASEEVETQEAPEETPSRSEFPEVLFYGLVAVERSKELVIPVGDALATFVVEAFALVDGDWNEMQRAFTVDQPVRLDVELPPSVHPKDKVVGRIRAHTSSGQGRLTLEWDGKPVMLSGGSLAKGMVVDTPRLVELDVGPGNYSARLQDVATGEEDSVEVAVEQPGPSALLGEGAGAAPEGGSCHAGRCGRAHAPRTSSRRGVLRVPRDRDGRLRSSLLRADRRQDSGRRVHVSDQREARDEA